MPTNKAHHLDGLQNHPQNRENTKRHFEIMSVQMHMCLSISEITNNVLEPFWLHNIA